MSAESLCFLRAPAEPRHMKKYLEKLSCDVVIIACLRNLKDWQKSNSAQLAKMKYHGSHIYPLPASNRVDAKWYYNHDAIKNFWGQVGPVKIIDYDEVIKNDRSVIPSFMKTIDREHLIPKKDYSLNVSSNFKS